MFIREENLGLEGVCASCSNEQQASTYEVVELRNLYITWDCNSCGYENFKGMKL
jgi:hypothetical protein